jgi:DNA replication and repair protein RecF
MTLSLLSPMNQPICGIYRLVLHCYRNYLSFELKPDSPIVAITGPNGSGKTNILESLGFFSKGKSLRGAPLRDVMHHDHYNEYDQGKGGWGVYAEGTSHHGHMFTLGTTAIMENSREKRLIKINGQLIQHQKGFSDYISMLWLTPQMDGLFIQSSSERRRFLDHMVDSFDEHHSKRLSEYAHFLKERSKILSEKGIHNSVWLDGLEQSLSEHAVAIMVARHDMANRLNEFQKNHDGFFPSFHINVHNPLLELVLTHGAVDAEEKIKNYYKEARYDDSIRGGSRIGPHRHDYEVTHLRKNITANLCSTGEQRVLLISILLTFAYLLKKKAGLTLLLLDDVVSFLDSDHRQYFFKELIMLRDHSIQAWLTGTDSFLFQDLSSYAFFHQTN